MLRLIKQTSQAYYACEVCFINYVNFETLLSKYHSIFGSHLRYACQVWGQFKTVCFSKIVSLQNRAIRIIHFC